MVRYPEEQFLFVQPVLELCSEELGKTQWTSPFLKEQSLFAQAVSNGFDWVH
jgi:hypothetical protein